MYSHKDLPKRYREGVIKIYLIFSLQHLEEFSENDRLYHNFLLFLFFLQNIYETKIFPLVYLEEKKKIETNISKTRLMKYKKKIMLYVYNLLSKVHL